MNTSNSVHNDAGTTSTTSTAQRRTRGVIGFLVLAFGLAWAIWGILLLIGIGPRDVRFQAWGTLAGFTPALAAVLARLFISKEGFSDAGLKPKFHRWQFYLFAWLSPVLIASSVIGLSVMFRLGYPDPSLTRAFAILTPGETPPPLMTTLPIPTFPLLLALLTALLMFGEEFGWRGYLESRFLPGRPLASAVVTGAVWALWHLPLILSSGDQYADTPVQGVLVFTITGILLSIIWTWLRRRTGSIWVACLAHGAANSAGSLPVIALLYGSPLWTYNSFYGILGWIPLGAVCIWIIATGQYRLPDAALTDIRTEDSTIKGS